jgi:hypothetical protein
MLNKNIQILSKYSGMIFFVCTAHECDGNIDEGYIVWISNRSRMNLTLKKSFTTSDFGFLKCKS